MKTTIVWMLAGMTALSCATAWSRGKSEPSAKEAARQAVLAQRLQPLLPAGMTLASASAGFKNQKVFLITLHVSQSLNVPFDKLKEKTAGKNAEPIERAVHELNPNLDAQTIRFNVDYAGTQAQMDQQSYPEGESPK